jgi:hypothetical protein
MKIILYINVLFLMIIFSNSSISHGTIPPDNSIDELNRIFKSLEKRINRLETRNKIAKRLMYYNPSFSDIGAGYVSDVIMRYSSIHNLDPLNVAGMIMVESSADFHAISPKGAKGLMQLLPVTARGLGYEGNNLHQPEDNIEYGTKYLSMLIQKRGHENGIKSYFCGETNGGCLKTKNADKYYNDIITERDHIKYAILEDD